MLTQALRRNRHRLLAPSKTTTDDHPATLLARLDELRRQIVVTLCWVAVAFVVCFSFSDLLVRSLMAPIRQALPPEAMLVATQVPEIFMLHVRVSLLAAIALACPVWLYQAWSLLASFSRPQRAMTWATVAALGGLLFGLGTAFGHFVLFPQAVTFLTGFGSRTVHVLLSVGNVFSLYSRLVLAIGIAFQVPTVVYVLSQLGLVTPGLLFRWWKAVVVTAFTLAAVVTPTPDIVTQSLLAIPLVLLYLVSIGLCWLVRLRHGLGAADPSPGAR